MPEGREGEVGQTDRQMITASKSMFRQCRPLKGPKFAHVFFRSGIGNGPINFKFNGTMRNAKRKSAAADKNDNLSNGDDLALPCEAVGGTGRQKLGSSGYVKASELALRIVTDKTIFSTVDTRSHTLPADSKCARDENIENCGCAC